MRYLVFVFCALLCACGGVDRSALTVFTSKEGAPLVRSYASHVPFAIEVKESSDPAADAKGGSGKGINVAVLFDGGCDGCYRVDSKNERYVVHGGGVLGAQYGLTHVLEAYGFRFLHPYRAHAPEKLTLISDAGFNEDHAPEQALRGISPHTLHPIEAYFDFWEPSAENLAGARQIIDWVVKNRGNYVQWPSLDNIQRDPAAAAAWADHTKQILDEAHARGVKVGVGVELFGSSNLQKAFDLIDTADDPPDVAAQIEARMKVLLDLPFDVVNLSFGEFSSITPERFIARVNDVYAACQKLRPGVELTATIHVGKDQTVTYDGKTFIYYFLVKYVDPHVIPWVHSVMYYDLFEDAGGAYKSDDFSEHRAYLQERISAGQRAAYFPESAYWVAFDNCVPTYVPLYIRSRWLDLHELKKAGTPLNEYVEFSSGWEWGYWQQDVAALRMGYALPERYEDFAEFYYAPFGDSGKKLADAVNALAEAQHDALLVKRLAPYFASRDALMDVGRGLGIISQPDRVEMSDLKAMDSAEREAFRSRVVQPMQAFADAMAGIQAQVEGAGMPEADPFYAEIRDGVAIDVLRAKFAATVWQVPLDVADGKDATPLLNQVDSILAEARTVVSRRRDGMHDPRFKRLLTSAENATVYPYGYLQKGNTLCFWEKERVQARALVNGIGETVPACVEVDLQ